MSEDAFPVFVMLSMAAVSLASIVVSRYLRHKDFSRLASALGMEYLKWELRDFPTNMLDPLGSWDKAQEVYRRKVSDGVVMFFTIEQGFGRQAYQRTIVARRYDKDVPALNNAFSPPVQLLEYGRWKAVTRVRPWLGSATMRIGTIKRAFTWLG